MARTDRVVLLTGDYAQRLDALYGAALEALEDESPRTMLEGDPYADLQAEYAALRAEAEAAATVVELTAVGRKEWRVLRDKYPPRTEGPDHVLQADRMGGVNTDAIEDDLVYASVTTPSFTSRAAFDEWADALSEGEWQTIVRKAWELANGARFDPKSLPASRTPSTD